MKRVLRVREFRRRPFAGLAHCPVSVGQTWSVVAGHGRYDAVTPVDGGDQPPLLAAIDQTLFPSGLPLYTARELATRAGVRVDIADRLWRAMGFTREPDDRAHFRDE